MSLPPEIKLVPIGKLRRNKHNVRTHSKKQIKQIAASIARFDWTAPIVTDEHGVILAGHGRYDAAILLKLKEVPVHVLSGLRDAEKRIFMLADNKLPANAGWDRKALVAELGELAALLPDCDLGIEITGFEPGEVDLLLSELVDPEADPADDLPPIAKNSISKPGDCWLLGTHRLLCGDACSAADVAHLMARNRAAMVITDPPYNQKIQHIQGRGRTKHREFMQASGELSSPQFRRFLQAALFNTAKCSVDGSIHFVFMDWRHIGELLASGAEVYAELKNIVVWVKTNAGQGSFYRSQHEFIFVYKHGNGPHINNFELGRHGRNRSNVWTYAGANTFRAGRMDDLAMHPTVKPVALVADALRDCSRRGDIVLDPFMGSGTTIMAAERVGRRAYGLEIDPAYVDVAIRRWQQYTKQDAIHEQTGQTFDESSTPRQADGGAP